mmetsp:Transcript_4203/g.11416  ORF Transcript_4203/g.11416 Transcript_4203/m.11416 type:complete len:415 (+) Transcript_4203:105-1349(+)|eukprot:CAMPEP_0168727148 /NCGR_PEP_ID=MMETSP0724-20121128/5031_1 /TAXON_ID=265536 /ORGANISM="Amphiprora sp., Strain CCMP467" /LENGTH=414 /DNA_ID=CAMNT_0008773977 /DNA_START=34 /DNA_END=1278 /DNA_ORIENTATION=-
MPLESCIVLLDCSEFMRNGDYVPTRLEAQQDAANLLVGAKTQDHPQSTVGVSAGTQVLVSPTREIGQILSALHSAAISMGGSTQSQASNSDLTAAVQVASLALKHRPEKNGGQRIVAFVGTPVDNEVKALQKAGRQLKKNNIAIDVVAMGELDTNEPKLRELVDAANGRSDDGNERTCHLVTIPAGVLPSDVLASSPIVGAGQAFAAQAAAATMAGNNNNFADYGGVDPNMDPELAMVLRMSMEEERARQERAAAAAAETGDEGGGDAAAPAASADTPMAEAANDVGLSEEEALLQQALAMSMNENEPATSSESKEEDAKPAAAAPAAAEAPQAMDLDDEDAAMQMALQMSMQQEASAEEGKDSGAAAASSGQFQDPSFVNELLGADTSDPEIQEALRKSKEQQEEDEDKKKEG